MANTIRIKRRLSGGGAGGPSTLAAAELAFNETSGSQILYYGLGDVAGVASSVIAIAGPDFVPGTIPNLTGVVTSVGTTTSIANAAITNAMLANTAVANLSGTNTGDDAVNTLYSGLVSNATHTGDATGSTSLTVVAINGVLMSGLATGILKNTTSTGVPSIAVAGADYLAPGGALGTPSSGDLTNCTFPILNQNTSGNAATVTTNANLTGPITSSGNATSVASQTGTGSKFVMDTSPTLVTPDIGAATGTSLVLSGDLTVNGTTTTISSTTLAVGDKNIVLASASTTDAGADGGGITIKGLSDKLWTWVDSTNAWTSSEHIDVASGKSYYINGTVVLSATSLGSGIILDGGTF